LSHTDRAKLSVSANFMLVAAMNLCAEGFHSRGHGRQPDMGLVDRETAPAATSYSITQSATWSILHLVPNPLSVPGDVPEG